MLIGELARAAGATVRALRYYEHQGLLHPRRARNGYRRYDQAAVTRVRNIQRLLSLGFTADDIKTFLPCLDGDMADGPACPPNVPAITRKLAELDGKIADLNAIRAQLADTLTRATAEPGGAIVESPPPVRTPGRKRAHQRSRRKTLRNLRTTDQGS